MKYFKIKYLYLLIGILIGFLSGVLINSAPQKMTAQYNNPEYQKALKVFNEALDYTMKHYVEEDKVSNYRKLFYGAIDGMLKSIGDNYSYFLDEEDWERMEIDITGSFVGVGMYILEDEDEKGVIIVISPIEDAPAWTAGIRPGDRIIEIDGIPTNENDFDFNRNLIKGEENTYVTFKIERIGYIEPIKIRVRRGLVKEVTVKGYMIDEETGYIKISGFNEETDKDLIKTLKELKLKGIKKYIVDLRNNPGGLLDISVRCIDRFVEAGKICYTQGRYEDENTIYYARNFTTELDETMPLIVLVNENSASSSEIFAGALKELKRAKIIGTKTFGKGLVQRIYPLQTADNLIGISLTIQKYFTSSGTDINQIGILPDIEINLPEYTQDDYFFIHKIRNYENNRDLIREFYINNPDFTELDIDKFLEKLRKMDMNIGKFALQSEIIYERNKYNIVPFDLEYDIQLKRAYKEISSINY